MPRNVTPFKGHLKLHLQYLDSNHAQPQNLGDFQGSDSPPTSSSFPVGYPPGYLQFSSGYTPPPVFQ